MTNIPQITVCTPTFNRAHTLYRVHDCLEKQTFKDFEWLIVDDGSTDGTEDLVRQWSSQSTFPIRYIYQPNQGKHIAFNRGVRDAAGWLFGQLDSDDSIFPTTLEDAIMHWREIGEVDINRFVGVVGLCVDQNGRIVGSRFPFDITDSDSLEIRYKHKVLGEKWGLLRTEVLRKFPFPDVGDARFVPESIVWSSIARSFKTRFVNKTFRVYYQDTSATSDQLTRQPCLGKDAAGMAIWHKSILDNELDYFRYSPKDFLRSAVHFVRFSLHAGSGVLHQIASLNSWQQRVLWFFGAPAGTIIYFYDKRHAKRR